MSEMFLICLPFLALLVRQICEDVFIWNHKQ